MDFERVVSTQRPDYRDWVAPVSAVWPEFMLQDPISIQYWDGLFEDFGAYQFALRDPETDAVAAKVNSVPLAWEGDLGSLPEAGWDWALVQSADDLRAGRAARVLCAIQIAVPAAYQGRGVSKLALEGMRQLAAERDLALLIAPVRPSQKSRYPLTSIDRYIHWRRPDGQLWDAWLRVHERAGAQLIKPCHQALHVRGTIAEWEAWTGLHFPDSGPYVIEGALNPVDMDVEADRGIYVEPNVWMVHPVP
jgi:GNAT superfamily N-acetyltransferase